MRRFQFGRVPAPKLVRHSRCGCGFSRPPLPLILLYSFSVGFSVELVILNAKIFDFPTDKTAKKWYNINKIRAGKRMRKGGEKRPCMCTLDKIIWCRCAQWSASSIWTPRRRQPVPAAFCSGLETKVGWSIYATTCPAPPCCVPANSVKFYTFRRFPRARCKSVSRTEAYSRFHLGSGCFGRKMGRLSRSVRKVRKIR